MPLNLLQFIARRQAFSPPERTGALSHFIDLCEVIGVPWPAAFNLERAAGQGVAPSLEPDVE